MNNFEKSKEADYIATYALLLEHIAEIRSISEGLEVELNRLDMLLIYLQQQFKSKYNTDIRIKLDA